MGDEIPNPKVLEKLEGVGNGQTGIDLALENVPDIIISDVMMPEKALRSPFLDRGKEVIALGISFSSAEKAVAEWQAVPY